MARREQRNCLLCGEMFRADWRNARHQKYCSEAGCRKASKAASRRAWLAKPGEPGLLPWTGECRPGAVMASGPTLGTGDDREGKGERCRVRRLRYKISARRKRLKSLTMRKACCNLRYKISCSINRLF
jgi:hypothetical protein